ncbi:cell wall-binding repeat-containing protein [Euzebya tangerina]|uniref:cell wall-binding repeat-containing protein n=1 Tax=Euzebya tangerina TaxID=591198 RepID=UPI000E3244A4|nr:cell wall-binding repeat-containing protein [Euzebya tangerina]
MDHTGGLLSTARVWSTVLVALVLVLGLVPPVAGQTDEVVADRLAGATRVETAAAVALEFFADGADEAVIVSASRFQEALAGAPYAASLDAPVIVTPPDALHPVAAETLATLDVRRVTVLGDHAVVGEDVVRALVDRGLDVRRVGADTPYATAAELALEVVRIAGPRYLGSRPTILLASGEDFADALAASGPAAVGPYPLLLTRSARLPDATRDALQAIGPARVMLFGGEQAVSADVLAEVEAIGDVVVERIAGETRTVTAAAAADRFVELGLMEDDTVIIARGDDFPDDLTAAAAARTMQAPILLTATSDLLSDDTEQWLQGNCGALTHVRVIGGESAVSSDTMDQAQLAATCSSSPGPALDPEPDPTPEPTPEPQPTIDPEPPPDAPDATIPGVPPLGWVRWGAAVGGNADPVDRHEVPAGSPLGVRRTFFQWNTRSTGMIRTAEEDLAAGRLPWVSVKTPSWAAMGEGAHDAEIDEMLRALEATGGPVWLTVHHEPEGGGGVNAPDDPAGPAGHVAMNRRVRQRMDALGISGVALVSIFMDYTWEPASGRDITQWWDDGIYDILGVDVYRYQPGTLVRENWDRVRTFAEAKGVPVAVGEWGIRGTDAAAGQHVREWFEMAVGSHADGEGARVVALSAFDSGLNSPSGSWELRGEQLRVFHELLGDPRAAHG